ncbi:hypothetical protein HHI36_007896 [Cryptolaemus montrouzieri]|uniref:Uncharacterized protein n=1 Tax=Cryptolaemus montrouzieri TaxID=559131 RepID=A0ABD2MQY1_9CUCU
MTREIKKTNEMQKLQNLEHNPSKIYSKRGPGCKPDSRANKTSHEVFRITTNIHDIQYHRKTSEIRKKRRNLKREDLNDYQHIGKQNDNQHIQKGNDNQHNGEPQFVRTVST